MNIQRIFTLLLIFNLALGLAPVPQPVLAASPAEATAGEFETLTKNGETSQADSLPEGVSADWWAQAQEYIRQSEYTLSGAPGAYQAPNRAQDLRIYFTLHGLHIIPRTESTPSWQLDLTLSTLGTPERLRPAGEAVLIPTANRIDYQREELAEWYTNAENGLEQGFILQPAATSDEPYLIDLSLAGTLTPRLAEDGRTVEFSAPDGSLALRYGNWQAVDAAGKSQPVELALLEGDAGKTTLRLMLPPFAQPLTITARLAGLEATSMAAPQTATGLPNASTWSYINAQPGAWFGLSVSAAGDVNGDGYGDIIVGAPLYDNGKTDQGKASVWYGSKDGLGLANRAPNWEYSGERAGDWFGSSVDAAGDVNGDGYDDILIGALWADSDTLVNEGAAYLWLGTSDGLGSGYVWKAAGGASHMAFGHAVSGAGDVDGDGYDDIIAGTPYYDNSPSEEVGVFVWYGKYLLACSAAAPCKVNLTSRDWQYESNQASAGYEFFLSVDSAGDVNGDGYSDILVGMPYYDDGKTNQGKAFLWYGSASGLGASQREPNWTMVGEDASDLFGYSVSAGDVNGDGYSDLLVGAPGYENGSGEDNEGAVYLWYGSATGMSAAVWRYEANHIDDQVGYSVSAGDVNGDGYADILVGAYTYDSDSSTQDDEGAAFLWYGSAAGIGAAQRNPDWMYQANHVDDRFGNSVSVAGDVNGDGYNDILIGALGTDGSAGNDVGQVYVFHGAPGGPLALAGKLSPSPQADAQLGYSVNTAGDVNGDGYSDFLSGARSYDDGKTDQGKVFLWYGSAAGLDSSPGWTKAGENAGDQFGHSVSTAGDVNNDGYDDIIVGARYYENVYPGQETEGAAYLWWGAPGGLDSGYAWRAESNSYSTDFGYSVATAGDVDGDGYDDIIVGAPYYDHSEDGEGGVFVWYGKNLLTCSAAAQCHDDLSSDWKYESNQASSLLGVSVDTAGDVNGDGYADIIVGAQNYDDGKTDQGKVFLWYGSAAGLGASQRNPDWAKVGENASDVFGFSVSAAGDVNGDGYSDILVGAPGYESASGEASEGAVYLWYGSATGMSATPWTYQLNHMDDQLGWSVSTAGDVNGDGYADILVGAPTYENDAWRDDEGAAYLWYGSAAGLGANQRSPDWRYEADHVNDLLGFAVNTAGDINGDGYSDILIGAPWADVGAGNTGQVSVFFGSGRGLGANEFKKIEADQRAGAQLGYAVGSAGDVNGDGYGDVIIGAPYFDNGQAAEGRVYVYSGSSTGILTSTVWFAESNLLNAHFGSAVGSAGDVNGDGYGDIIVGAPGFTNGQAEEGAVFVWHGSITGLGSNGEPGTADWRAEGNLNNALLGSAAASAGDVNGDGYGDVIIGAPGFTNGQANEGAAFVWYGSTTGLGANGEPANATWKEEGGQALAQFGYAVGSAGDVNGDSYSDILIGMPGYNNGQAGEGAAFVWYGASTGLGSRSTITSTGWLAESNLGNARLGSAVAGAGDVNGDGYSDIIIGAPGFNKGQADEGAVFAWYGASAGLGSSNTITTTDWMAQGNQTLAQFGYAVSSAGDINGDGYSDIIVGAPDYNNGPVQEGRSFVFNGAANGLPKTAHWTAEINSLQARFGYAVSSAGDVNGDGYADIIAGAPFYDLTGPVRADAGHVRVYYGNGKGALSPLPRQMRVSDAVPITPLGLSDSPMLVRLSLTGRMPLGREKLKVQWQAAPLGVPFTATTTATGTSITWSDTLTNGVSIPVQVTGLARGTPYKWRVRLLYSGNRLGLATSRWLTLAWNSAQEMDFRTLPSEITLMFIPLVRKKAEALILTAIGLQLNLLR